MCEELYFLSCHEVLLYFRDLFSHLNLFMHLDAKMETYVFNWTFFTSTIASLVHFVAPNFAV
jgi:hypothetical protein